MSRSNDALPMLPPWLSESEATSDAEQIGYEEPVRNLPQDDLIDERPNRRSRFKRGSDSERSPEKRRKSKRRDKNDEQPQRDQSTDSGWGSDSGWGQPQPTQAPPPQSGQSVQPPMPPQQQQGPGDQWGRSGPQSTPQPDGGYAPSHGADPRYPGPQQLPPAQQLPPQQPAPTNQQAQAPQSPMQPPHPAHPAQGSLPIRNPDQPSDGFRPLGAPADEMQRSAPATPAPNGPIEGAPPVEQQAGHPRPPLPDLPPPPPHAPPGDERTPADSGEQRAARPPQPDPRTGQPQPGPQSGGQPTLPSRPPQPDSPAPQSDSFTRTDAPAPRPQTDAPQPDPHTHSAASQSGSTGVTPSEGTRPSTWPADRGADSAPAAPPAPPAPPTMRPPVRQEELELPDSSPQADAGRPAQHDPQQQMPSLPDSPRPPGPQDAAKGSGTPSDPTDATTRSATAGNDASGVARPPIGLSDPTQAWTTTPEERTATSWGADATRQHPAEGGQAPSAQHRAPESATPPHRGTQAPVGDPQPQDGWGAQASQAPAEPVAPPAPQRQPMQQRPQAPDAQPEQQWQQQQPPPQQQQQWGAVPPPQQQQYQQPPQQGAPYQGISPSLDNVPMRRAKKAPGSGWRKAVHHVSGGAVNPGMSAEERRLQELVARIRQPVRGDYRIAVLSLKGGVGKTTTTMGIGSTFASIRGDRVIAVDANPDFGTLSQRVPLQTRSTVRDLLLDPAIQRYSDVRKHTSQATSRLEVLASERDPAASEAFSEEEYRAVARVLQRFYNIILTDCGTGLMHSAMSGVLDLAHSLVLISSPAIDGARSAAATLDWLSLHGHDHLVRNAVVVINSPRAGSPNVGIQQLREYFLSRCRAVHIIPFDPHMSEGAEIDLHRLHKQTKRAYVELAATVADDFATDHRRYQQY